MPTIDVMMARSLKKGAWEKIRDSLARSIAANMAGRLEERDIIADTKDKVNDIKTALSSWDNCMAVDYCKWPAIGIMIVGGLIIIGILWCIIRCACCGVACCCSCCRCFQCCGNCCGCCDAPGQEKKNKYLDAPYVPPEHGYRTEAPMHVAFPAVGANHPTAAPPQYAEFDVARKGQEDSLPVMPSWEASSSKHIAVENDAVELDHLKKSPAADSSVALMNGQSSVPTSPMPMEHPSGPGSSSRGYMPPQRKPTDPYAQNNNYGFNDGIDPNCTPTIPVISDVRSQSPAPSQYGYGADQGYGAPVPPMGAMRSQSPAFRNQNGYGAEPVYGAPVPVAGGIRSQSPAPAQYGYGSEQPFAAPVSAVGGMRTQSPAPRNQFGTPQNDFGNGGGYGQPPRGQTPNGYGMQRRGTGESGLRGSPSPYDMDPRMRNSPGPRRSPAPLADPYGAGARQSPAPQQGYGYGAPAYGAPQNDMPRTFSPAPERQYGNQSPRPVVRQPTNRSFAQEEPPQSPIRNNAGFDFNSGYSRPQEYDRRPSESRETPAQEGYPGYKPYGQPQNGWSGI